MVISGRKTLLGRYRVEKRIGIGGMGSVYRAHDEVLDRPVAVKVLKEELADDAMVVRRFEREARIAAGLAHRGIAHVFDFAEDDGLQMIVMELLTGRDLHRLLAEDGPLSPERAAQVAAEIADALEHAHKSGAVHRDVKPGNIFITENGEVKVTDFGIATAASHSPLTAVGSLVGTPAYLSPEQVDGHKATPQSDIYALGCVLFESLTGQPPFTADTPVGIAMAHKNEPVPDVVEINPDVPASLSQVIETAMAKDPSDRFASAALMAEVLRSEEAPETLPGSAATLASMPSTAVLSDIDAPAIDASAIREATVRKVKRRRGPLIAIGIAILLVLLAFAAASALKPGSGSVTVPSVAGLTFEEASGRLEKLGLTPVRAGEEASVHRDGLVARQEPAPDAKLAESASRRVSLWVSTGPSVTVPSVEGLPLAEAVEKLTGLGLKPEIVSGEGDRAVVASQDPKPDASVAPGTTVRLVGAAPREESEGGKGKGKGKDDE